MDAKRNESPWGILAGWATVAAVAILSAWPQAILAAESGTRPRISLLLGGGGACGSARIGVVDVMERLRVDCVAGSSMGSLVAGQKIEASFNMMVDNVPIGEADCGWSESSARCRWA